MRTLIRTPETAEIKAHCIEIYHFFQVVEHYEDEVSSGVSLDSKREINVEDCEKWSRIQDKFLAAHSNQIDKALLKPILSNLRYKSHGDSSPLKSFVKKKLLQLSIWSSFSGYEIDNIAPYYNDLNIMPKFERSQLIEILFPS